MQTKNGKPSGCRMYSVFTRACDVGTPEYLVRIVPCNPCLTAV